MKLLKILNSVMKRVFFSILSSRCVFRLMWMAGLLLPAVLLPAQELSERPLTLTEAIVLARKQSVDAAYALGQLKSAYWLSLIHI